jgi:hypothetical protein
MGVISHAEAVLPPRSRQGTIAFDLSESFRGAPAQGATKVSSLQPWRPLAREAFADPLRLVFS